ncbi:aminoglycoside phosphotransferase [Bryobacterales bacterium F-183]|nr:aminoglycoside phosphotransferase [Bryobacterales bacterium F-183]
MALFELTAGNAEEYLRHHHGTDATNIVELGGGVSNAVLRVEPTQGEAFVIKQSLEKLRVEQDWFSDRDRIHRECDAIRMLHADLAPGSVPAIVFEDRDNCIYAMSAAPADARPWKSLLMEGILDLATVQRVGDLLASIIRVSRGNPRYRDRFHELRVFDQLRLDAYYRATALRHPDLAAYFHQLIHDTEQRDFSLVHGDWSPKNLLVSPGAVMAIDFEVVHYADPAFDAGFVINHLLLKSLYLNRPDYTQAALQFFAALPQDQPWLEAATIRHLAALMLARVDGKSPAEYITGPLQQKVRTIAISLIRDTPPSLVATMERLYD